LSSPGRFGELVDLTEEESEAEQNNCANLAIVPRCEVPAANVEALATTSATSLSLRELSWRCKKPENLTAYHSLHQEDAVLGLVLRDQLIDRLRAANKELKENAVLARRIGKENQSSNSQVVPVQENAKANADFHLVWKGHDSSQGSLVGRQRWHLATKSLIVAAVRRNISSIAAADLGHALLADMSRNVVTASETFLGAIRIGAFRVFHETQESEMISVCTEHPEVLGVAVHAYSSDATNSSVWQQSKLFSTEVESSYFHVDSEFDSVLPGHSKKAFADIQRVGESNAEACQSLLDNQLESVGVPLPWQMDKANKVLPSNVVRLLLCTGDGGPDQRKYKSIMKSTTNKMPSVLFIPNLCNMHNAQLIIKVGLRVIDSWCSAAKLPWKYYSGLAKLVHCWRENVKDVYNLWVGAFGAVDANRSVGKLPAKCIAGRWGSIAETERDLTRFDRSRFRKVMVHALVHRCKNTKSNAKMPPPLQDEVANLR
jgi:hypothetical protein